MGSAIFRKIELAATLSEAVGYKSGLALNAEEIADHLGEAADFVQGEPDDRVIVRGEELEEMVAALLFSVGNTPVPHVVSPVIQFTLPFRGNPSKLAKALRVVEIFTSVVSADRGDGPIDATPVGALCLKELGPDGLALLIEFSRLVELKVHQTPFGPFRRIEWRDTAELRDLFESEKLAPQHGKYLDQRFIDYLAQNFASIDDMNWRKFEGLACEYFEREGYYVEIAEGRNDGGIDARVWKTEPSKEEPPSILVQCKRQKDKVEKVVVKALWADVMEESAESGLVVTSSSLSPGAEKVCIARGYPVSQANRETLKQWVAAMRTPFAGVFLGM
jgi:restriction system protein